MRRLIAAVALVPVLVAALAVQAPRPSFGQEPFPTPVGQLGGPERLDPTPGVPTPAPPSPSPPTSPTPAPSATSTPTDAPPTPSPADPGATTVTPSSVAVEEIVARVGPAVVMVVPAAVALTPGGQQIRPAAVASGVFIDDVGHVLTVASVADQADEFVVTLASGDTRRGQLVGIDDVAGVALLRVEGPVPAFSAPADGVALRPGQEVLALGAALSSLPGTVTTGVVSAPDRALPWASTPFRVVQHSAPVISGMEGGPLLDRSGNLVGLLLDPLALIPPPSSDLDSENSVIGSVGELATPDIEIEILDPLPDAPERALSGLSFAITAETITRVVPDLLDDGRPAYPFLGVSVSPSPPPGPGPIGLPTGALVIDLDPSGPAAVAGIEVDDLILAIDGDPIRVDRPLVDLIFSRRPGDSVVLTVRRGREELSIVAILGERPAP